MNHICPRMAEQEISWDKGGYCMVGKPQIDSPGS